MCFMCFIDTSGSGRVCCSINSDCSPLARGGECSTPFRCLIREGVVCCVLASNTKAPAILNFIPESLFQNPEENKWKPQQGPSSDPVNAQSDPRQSITTKKIGCHLLITNTTVPGAPLSTVPQKAAAAPAAAAVRAPWTTPEIDPRFPTLSGVATPEDTVTHWRCHPISKKVSRHIVPNSVLRAVLGRMQFTLDATRRTLHGASHQMQAMSAWLVKTRRAPSRRSRNARFYGHTTTAIHKLITPPHPPPRAGCEEAFE